MVIVSYTDVIGLWDPCERFRGAFDVRNSRSSDRSRVVVCDVRFSVVVSVTSNKVLVIVFIYENVF